jgi:hypothetical protein
MPKPEPSALREPSEMFNYAFSAHLGTIAATCELCGVHVAVKDGLIRYGDDGELEEFEANVAKDPAHYELWDDGSDSLSLGQVDGRQFVVSHQCNLGRRYEDFVRFNRYQIADYLRAFAKKRAERAAVEQKTLGVIPQTEALA